MSERSQVFAGLEAERQDAAWTFDAVKHSLTAINANRHWTSQITGPGPRLTNPAIDASRCQVRHLNTLDVWSKEVGTAGTELCVQNESGEFPRRPGETLRLVDDGRTASSLHGVRFRQINRNRSGTAGTT